MQHAARTVQISLSALASVSTSPRALPALIASPLRRRVCPSVSPRAHLPRLSPSPYLVLAAAGGGCKAACAATMSPAAEAAPATAGGLEHELQQACAAVRLASALCQARTRTRLYAFAQPMVDALRANERWSTAGVYACRVWHKPPDASAQCHLLNGQYTVESRPPRKRPRVSVPPAQRVQLQLQSAEQASKDDASPVTIADYGAPASTLFSFQATQGRDPAVHAELHVRKGIEQRCVVTRRNALPSNVIA